MLGMSRCNMVFDLNLGRSMSDYNNIGSLDFNHFIINAFVHHLVFVWHGLQLGFWRLRRSVAVSLTRACRRTYPLRECRRASRLLFRMHRAQFLIASYAPILLNLGVPDVRTTL